MRMLAWQGNQAIHKNHPGDNPMDIRPLSQHIAVSAQINKSDLAAIAQAGYRAVICNRPDDEGADQANFAEIQSAAQLVGLDAHYLPAESGKVSDAQGVEFGALMATLPKPVLAYCRTGMRSTSLWALANAQSLPLPTIIESAAKAGYDIKALVRRIANGGKTPVEVSDASHDVVIVGGGAAGISVAASLLARDPMLDIAIVDPADIHYYQPGWTLVGAGVFDAAFTARTMAGVLPHGVHWIKAAVAAFEPERHAIVLEGCRVVRYQQLVVCPGLKVDWHGIEGLAETLGQNGVTSNYRYDLAPYTWELVKNLKGGKAIFTQPPMPIKCAGAPQKAMYMSADHWRRAGHLNAIDIQFCNAGAVLFGVADYVPALMEYVNAYGITLNFGRTLVAVDGAAKKATFSQNAADGSSTRVDQDFDMIHVVPPQKAPDFVRVSPLAGADGWITVDPATLRHTLFENVFALGDATNTSNAKTAAAARKQAPVVAHNLLAMRGAAKGEAKYDGYGSCPLTVERGKIVLAEFIYGGKVAPSFPKWLIDGTRPSALAWYLKERVLPPLYWDAMLKGREWLAKPEMVG
jgi:sulfide:quinone oxidoreductase